MNPSETLFTPSSRPVRLYFQEPILFQFLLSAAPVNFIPSEDHLLVLRQEQPYNFEFDLAVYCFTRILTVAPSTLQILCVIVFRGLIYWRLETTTICPGNLDTSTHKFFLFSSYLWEMLTYWESSITLAHQGLQNRYRT